jgi:response regulator RpfG family c-di-GMP phosphodiesterase
MPGITGVELLARVRSEWPDAVRLVFTGYADVKAVIAAINQGHVFRYITKPWDPDELLCVLGQACEEHRRLAAQRRLLSDLREYQARTLAFLEGLRSGPPGAPGVDPMEPVDRLLETGHSLLARLEQLPEPEEALET